MNKTLKTILIVVAAVAAVSAVVFFVYRKLQKQIDAIGVEVGNDIVLPDDNATADCEVVPA
jgi:hypothetical protein